MQICEGQLWQDNYWSSNRPYRYARRIRLLNARADHVLARVEDDTTPFQNRGRIIQVRRMRFSNRPGDRFGFCLVTEEKHP